LNFLKTDDIKYQQFGDEFIPNLSIIDVMMFNSREKIQELLEQYTLQ
ncbi:MAG TPA: WbqC family protein, partial [Defluviitaleaceae bacterium]|nr:WbqC family protein [Defluviitaleaceae bacterium]